MPSTNVTISAAVFNPEKLDWLNQQYIKTAPPETLAKTLETVLVQEKILPQRHDFEPADIARVIPALNERSKTLVEMAHKAAFLFPQGSRVRRKRKTEISHPGHQTGA